MNEINFEQARFNMIEQQIRPWEVLDQRVLDTIAAVPRESFVPERYRNLAFADVRIPLGHGQTMMNPNVEGRILQSVQATETDRVLEIGTGSGYLTACLAHLADSVLSVDIEPQFTASAEVKLKAHGCARVVLETGDAARDWGNCPFDIIALTGSVPGPAACDSWRQRLAIGGRLFAIVGESPIMEGCLVTRTGPSEWVTEGLFDTEIAPLTNAARAAEFSF